MAHTKFGAGQRVSIVTMINVLEHLREPGRGVCGERDAGGPGVAADGGRARPVPNGKLRGKRSAIIEYKTVPAPVQAS